MIYLSLNLYILSNMTMFIIFAYLLSLATIDVVGDNANTLELETKAPEETASGLVERTSVDVVLASAGRRADTLILLEFLLSFTSSSCFSLCGLVLSKTCNNDLTFYASTLFTLMMDSFMLNDKTPYYITWLLMCFIA